MFFFFFSSRRRHTRLQGDWSSDVCSSDLTTTLAAVNGVASFATLTLDKTGTSYWLTAAATGLNTATSSAFTIPQGTPTQPTFIQQPETAVANRLITPAVKGPGLDAPGQPPTS